MVDKQHDCSLTFRGWVLISITFVGIVVGFDLHYLWGLRCVLISITCVEIVVGFDLHYLCGDCGGF